MTAAHVSIGGVERACYVYRLEGKHPRAPQRSERILETLDLITDLGA